MVTYRLGRYSAWAHRNHRTRTSSKKALLEPVLNRRRIEVIRRALLTEELTAKKVFLRVQIKRLEGLRY